MKMKIRAALIAALFTAVILLAACGINTMFDSNNSNQKSSQDTTAITATPTSSAATGEQGIALYSPHYYFILLNDATTPPDSSTAENVTGTDVIDNGGLYLINTGEHIPFFPTPGKKIMSYSDHTVAGDVREISWIEIYTVQEEDTLSEILLRCGWSREFGGLYGPNGLLSKMAAGNGTYLEEDGSGVIFYFDTIESPIYVGQNLVFKSRTYQYRDTRTNPTSTPAEYLFDGVEVLSGLTTGFNGITSPTDDITNPTDDIDLTPETAYHQSSAAQELPVEFLSND